MRIFKKVLSIGLSFVMAATAAPTVFAEEYEVLPATLDQLVAEDDTFSDNSFVYSDKYKFAWEEMEGRNDYLVIYDIPYEDTNGDEWKNYLKFNPDYSYTVDPMFPEEDVREIYSACKYYNLNGNTDRFGLEDEVDVVFFVEDEIPYWAKTVEEASEDFGFDITNYIYTDSIYEPDLELEITNFNNADVFYNTYGETHMISDNRALLVLPVNNEVGLAHILDETNEAVKVLSMSEFNDKTSNLGFHVYELELSGSEDIRLNIPFYRLFDGTNDVVEIISEEYIDFNVNSDGSFDVSAIPTTDAQVYVKANDYEGVIVDGNRVAVFTSDIPGWSEKNDISMPQEGMKSIEERNFFFEDSPYSLCVSDGEPAPPGSVGGSSYIYEFTEDREYSVLVEKICYNELYMAYKYVFSVENGVVTHTDTITAESGDTNGDGICYDLYDMIATAKHIINMETLDDISMVAADVNNDDMINVYDVIIMARKYLGIK